MSWKNSLLPLLFLIACAPQKTHVKSEKIPEPIVGFNPKRAICYTAGQAIIIDGKLNEDAWLAVEWTDDFMDIEGPSKPVPRFRTRAKMLWDNEYFYIAAELEEPHVWATLKEHDSIIFNDNDFEVFIDPDGDTHDYYELEVNALGTAWDLFLPVPYRDGGGALFFWDIRGLRVGVHVKGSLNKTGDVDKGWQVEIALPWEVLREVAPEGRMPVPGDQWRVNFSRVEWQVEVKNGKYVKLLDKETGKLLHEDNWVWSPQGVVNMHYPEMWGKVHFSGKTAGHGTDAFVVNPEDAMKWELRRIYYRQQAYYQKTGRFSGKYSELGLKRPQLIGFIFEKNIDASDYGFEAICRSVEGPLAWTIALDGRIRIHGEAE